MTVVQENPGSTPVLAPVHPNREWVTVIEPKSGWVSLDLKDVWAYRDLLLTFAVRDIKLRYRQTALGAIWVVFQPIMTSLIFTVIFGFLAGMKSERGPYFVLAFTGSMAWSLFASTLNKANVSMVQNANLVSKIYFPRLVLPLSTLFSTLIDFGISMAVMIIFLIIFQITPTLAVFLLPVWVLVLLASAIGIGMYSAALTVSYRDVQYILPVMVQLATFASPVGFSVASGQAKSPLVQWFFSVNPLTAPLEGFRWALLGTAAPTLGSVIYSIVFSVFVLLVGAYTFRRMERRFADVI